MNAFEICLVILALIAAGLGGHGIGYARGRRVRPRYRRSTDIELTNAYTRGFRDGREDERELWSPTPAPLPRKITEPMPVVPVSVDGDEVGRPE